MSQLDVHINGNPHSLPAAATVIDVLRALGVDPEARGIAVAVGDSVVRRSEWGSTRIEQGQHIEVVTATQGG